jgi:hypothetical protein
MSDGGGLYDLALQWVQKNQATIDAIATASTLFTGLGHSTTDVETVIANYQNRITALEGGGTLTQYNTSQTWTNPTPTEHNLITVIAICGGQGGGKGSTTTFVPPLPGRSGGYVSQQLYTNELPSTVAITIGTGGAGASSVGRGTLGGSTSFGSYCVGSPGVGAVYKADGTYAVTVPPGDGGMGGQLFTGTNNWSIPNTDGVPGAFSASGQAGMGAVGGDGAAAPSGIPAGGAGGGGGGANNSAGFAGGAGGAPGGGGGGGGVSAATGSVANGGVGAVGCLYIIS